MRSMLSLVAGAVLSVLGATVACADDRPVVVELFTSQGCSSCPPADALLGELSRRPGILALSFHVNYWDRLGWRDPFATKAGTDRQYAYSETLGRGNVYTPQMVVDGRIDVVGSRREEVLDAVAARRDAGATGIDIGLERRHGALVARLPAAPVGSFATIWMIEFDAGHETAVAGGENGGRTLHNRNVVRRIRQIGPWSGERREIALPAPTDGRGAAVLAQERRFGPILGAAWLPPRGQ